MVRYWGTMLEEAQKHLKEVEQRYPGLRLKSCDNGYAIYSGKIAFTADYEGRGLIDDEFEVEVIFPLTVTDKVPKAKEIGGRIPHDFDFHVYPDGRMCLGAPLGLRRKYIEQPTLHAFIDDMLIPFLYSFSFKEKHGYMPFGELSHGGKGIAEYYREFFETDSDLAVLELLKIIAADNYRGHMPCPCGSGERLRKCHGPQIREIKDQQSREDFLNDLAYCFGAYKNSGKKLPRGFLTKRLEGYVKKISLKYNTKEERN